MDAYLEEDFTTFSSIAYKIHMSQILEQKRAEEIGSEL